jgi:hypothetical protein
LSKHLGFTKDISKSPLKTILQLFELRNALAHGRTQNLTIKKTTESIPAHDAAWRLLPMEQLIPETVRQYHDDVQAAIELINSARRSPDKLLWDQGSRASKISAIE